MKNTTVLVTLIFSFLVPAGIAHSASPVTIGILEHSANRIVVEYRFGNILKHPVLIDGIEHLQFRLESEAQIKTPGDPALPAVTRSYLLPDDAMMNVRILEVDFREQHNVNIAPSKGNIARSVNPNDVPFTFSNVYAVDAYYPSNIAVLGTPYILRDFRGAALKVHPIQYNPVKRSLRIHNSIKIEITAAGPARFNPIFRNTLQRSSSRSFHQVYNSHFINYAHAVRYNPLDEEGDMLIITHDPWMDAFQPFVDHKAVMGISATVVGVSSIGNDSTSIHNYIQTVFDSGNLAFVILGGDLEQVASTIMDYPLDSDAPSDPVYSLLAGEDTYPDILVGRFFRRNSPGFGVADPEIDRI